MVLRLWDEYISVLFHSGRSLLFSVFTFLVLLFQLWIFEQSKTYTAAPGVFIHLALTSLPGELSLMEFGAGPRRIQNRFHRYGFGFLGCWYLCSGFGGGDMGAVMSLALRVGLAAVREPWSVSIRLAEWKQLHKWMIPLAGSLSEFPCWWPSDS